ncbi:MAG: hypothetical protein KDA45_15820, partial [Planctomycetales bacterium]|nr:hypothetical protein [Planctomycetales bacterium]
AEKAVSDFLKIEPITRAELQQVRARSSGQQAAVDINRPVRIAVMPHLHLPEMNFSRRDPAVRFADEMRSQLETVGLDVDVVSNYELKRTFENLNLQGMQEVAALQQIGLGVAADYVFWGVMVDGQPDKVTTGIMDTKAGRFVVTIPGGIDTQFPPRASLCSTVLDALAEASRREGKPMQLGRVQRKFRTRLVANSEEVERLQIAARGLLEDATQLELGEGNSSELYAEAQKYLEQALPLDPSNPLINALLANVYFSQYQLLQANDDPGAGAKRRAANKFAGEAKRNLNRVLEIDQREIDADFNFYRGNFKQAAALYEEITQSPGETRDHVRRARWMLSGIYSGDWGIASSLPELVNAEKARQQIVQLLADFPDSVQAKLMEKHLVWDEARGQTRSANLPRTHVELTPE